MFYHYNDIMENGRYDLADDIRKAKEDLEEVIQEIPGIKKEVRELLGVLSKGFFLTGRKRRKERRSRS